ncbi:hypothetical protein [Paenibacillus piscarius]|uniref:hypothetical protein n=1 Tax=Paenibacillus piscarius TaxID=1089681 RepID=UPI001EE8CEDD|nr:hypothetical protein [Paenibacillus piscarius]
MTQRERNRIRRAINVLIEQRAILLARLERINESLRIVPRGTRARKLLLEARVSIREALRLNAEAIRLLRSVL